MRTLKNIAPFLSGIAMVFGGTMLAFGNDYGIIGLIPGIIYVFKNND